MSRFPSLRVEGGLISFDLIERIADGDAPGQKPADFGLPAKAHFLDEVADAWAATRRYWEAFRSRLEQLTEEDPGTSVTRDGWVIPLMSLLGYELIYQQKAHLVDGLTFAISHGANPGDDAPPVHVVGWRQELGKLPPSGRPRLAPHVLLQEYLNRTEHLWGVVTNGRILRILRDCQLLSRQAYIEFDLEAMLEGERLSDFAVLWRLIHRTRLPQGMDDAPECLLEHYYATSVEQGGRVRDHLRDGVEAALAAFGNGLLSHPGNHELRESVKSGEIKPESFYKNLLRLVYRLLFLMVAEERSLISPSPVYLEHYSMERLRRLADLRLPDEDHRDLWISLQATFDLFRKEELGSLLEVPPLNGELFLDTDLDRCSLYNRDLLAALRELSTYAEDLRSPRRRVNYSALDVEELGSVYESLLEYHPVFSEQEGRPVFRLVYGTERKTTGSYYTPPELVNELIKSALAPVLDARLEKAKGEKEKEQAILGMRVCDPACGSGHFLLAAARRLGKELARVRTGDEEPAPEEMRPAMRDVISHCIYGVDKNPLAVDLCKVALWIESHAEGRPLSFLDHRIRCGDSLVGVFDLKVLEKGIPDEAFNPVSGDDKTIAKSIKKDNKAERTEKVGWLSMDFEAASDIPKLSDAYRKLSEIPDDTPEQVRRKKELYDKLQSEGSQWWNDQISCHLWTCAFFTDLDSESYKDKAIPTTETLRTWLHNRAIDGRYIGHAWEMAQRYRFFHWPLEFPEVFEAGGFDVVLCNPPWERIKLQEQEFFATRDPEIASAPNKAARGRLIKQLPETDHALWEEYQQALHYAEAQSKFLRNSGRFPLTARGDINTYALFTELFRNLIGKDGRAGVVVETGIATDDTYRFFFQDIIERKQLVSIYDFVNKQKLFPDVEANMRFCLLTLTASEIDTFYVAAKLELPKQLVDPSRSYQLSINDIEIVNPNTLNLPTFSNREDALVIKKIFSRVPILVYERGKESNPWKISFLRMFDMTNDSHLFRTYEELIEDGYSLEGNVFRSSKESWLPIYESKLAHQYKHRAATFDGIPEADRFRIHAGTNASTNAQLKDPSYIIIPRYWIRENEVLNKVGNLKWFIGFRNAISATADARSLVATIVPIGGVGNSMPLLFTDISNCAACILLASLNTIVLDYTLRQKASGGNLNYYILKQLPIPAPESFSETENYFIVPRVLEAIYTSWDIKPFADDVWRAASPELRNWIQEQWDKCKAAIGSHNRIPPPWVEDALDGIPLPPFKWDDERLARIRAELDAYFANFYGLNRKQLRYILDPADLTENELENILDDYEEVDDLLDEEAYRQRCEASAFPGETFRVLKEKEIKQYGHYRTRHLALEAWQQIKIMSNPG